MGAHPRAEDGDFILEIEGLPKLKCEQAFERPNDEARQGFRGGIPEVQRGNAHVDDGVGVRRHSNPEETGGSHGGVAGETTDQNAH